MLPAALVRQLATDDMGQIRELAAEGEAEGFRFLARFVRELDAGVATLRGSSHAFLGAFDESSLIAVGGVMPDPYVARAGIGRIRHVYVQPAARRQGSGGGGSALSRAKRVKGSRCFG